MNQFHIKLLFTLRFEKASKRKVFRQIKAITQGKTFLTFSYAVTYGRNADCKLFRHINVIFLEGPAGRPIGS